MKIALIVLILALLVIALVITWTFGKKEKPMTRVETNSLWLNPGISTTMLVDEENLNKLIYVCEIMGIEYVQPGCSYVYRNLVDFVYFKRQQKKEFHCEHCGGDLVEHRSMDEHGMSVSTVCEKCGKIHPFTLSFNVVREGRPPKPSIEEEHWIVMPDKFVTKCEHCGGELELQSLMMENGIAYRIICKECEEI